MPFHVLVNCTAKPASKTPNSYHPASGVLIGVKVIVGTRVDVIEGVTVGVVVFCGVAVAKGGGVWEGVHVGGRVDSGSRCTAPGKAVLVAIAVGVGSGTNCAAKIRVDDQHEREGGRDHRDDDQTNRDSQQGVFDGWAGTAAGHKRLTRINASSIVWATASDKYIEFPSRLPLMYH